MRDQDEADTSRSTAEFRAFAERDPGTDISQPWAMKAQRNQVAKLVAIAIGVAVLLAIVAFLVIH